MGDYHVDLFHLSRIRKLIAATVGAALQAVNLGVLPGEVQPYLFVLITFLTLAGVYVAPNEQE